VLLSAEKKTLVPLLLCSCSSRVHVQFTSVCTLARVVADNSDNDESVDSPAPEAVPPPKENNSSTELVETVTASPAAALEAVQSTKPEIDSPAQQPAPASSVMAQPEQNLPISAMLVRAKELQEI
jgi:hypothetical protein